MKNERNVALSALVLILEEGGYNNIVLKKLLLQEKDLSSSQKAFVTELVNGTLRHLLFIDYITNQFSSKPVGKLKPVIRNLLRLSVYQLKFLTNIPQSAVCNEAVKLAKLRGFTNLAGFVNGVLRACCRKEITLSELRDDRAALLSVQYSHPRWMVDLWINQLGESETERLLQANNVIPQVSICVNTEKTTKASLARILEKEGVQVELSKWVSNGLLLKKTADISKLQSFQDGLFFVQDEASMLAVSALAPQGGDQVLDLCAAPGGKSFLAAAMMKGQGRVLARDVHPHKLGLIEAGAERLGLNIETEIWDGLDLDQKSMGQFDKVIVDAPCSGLGLIRKKPDLKWKREKEDIQELAQLQQRLLKNAVQYVKPGGVLVYSTCTLTEKENQENRQYILEHGGMELSDFSGYIPFDLPQSNLQEGYVSLFPHIHGTDGFFIARFEKKV